MGWVITSPELANALISAQQYSVFCVSTPLQEATAEALELASRPYMGSPSYFSWLRKHYAEKRDKMLETLQHYGLHVIRPQGSFFIMADFSSKAFPDGIPPEVTRMIGDGSLDIDPSTASSRDYNFCRWLTIEKGVTPIPPTAFYSAEHKFMAQSFARFAFCKEDAQIQEARNRLLSKEKHDKAEGR